MCPNSKPACVLGVDCIGGTGILIISTSPPSVIIALVFRSRVMTPLTCPGNRRYAAYDGSPMDANLSDVVTVVVGGDECLHTL